MVTDNLLLHYWLVLDTRNGVSPCSTAHTSCRPPHVPLFVAPFKIVPGVSQFSVVPAGSFLPAGLLPILEKLTTQLKFVEIRELTSEMMIMQLRVEQEQLFMGD